MKKILPILAITLLLGACSETPEKEDPNNWNVNNQNNVNNSNNQNNVNNQNNGNDVGNVDGGSTDTGNMFPEPDNHRPTAVVCDSNRPPGTVMGQNDPNNDCNDDSECTEGDNGRCNYERIGAVCSYDQCFEDTDCPNNTVCQCDGGWSGENFCMRGNCTTDADCPETGYCSPTFDDCGNYFGVTAYFCHTPEDECVNDSDCPDDPVGGGPPYCMYSEEAQHWVCSSSHCVG